MKKPAALLLAFLIIFSVDTVCADQAEVHSFKIAQSARYSAMAEAVTASCQGAQAMGINPAGTASEEKGQLALTYTKHLHNSFFLNLQHKQNFKALNLGGGLRFFFQGRENGFAADGSVMQNAISGLNCEATVNISRNFGELLSLGMNSKYIYQKQNSEIKSTWFTSDLGLILHAAKFTDKLQGLNLGFSVINLSTISISSPQQSRLPLVFRGGIGFDREISELFGLTCALDLETSPDNPVKVSLGNELRFKKMFSLQAGYKFGEGPYGFKYGVGFRILRNAFYYNVEFRKLGLIHRADYMFTFRKADN